MPHSLIQSKDEWRGERYGRLVVLAELEERDGRMRMVLCRCDCGTEKKVRVAHLRTGRIKSCGCLRRELSGARLRAQATTHGQHNSPTYQSWIAMKSRCLNPNVPRYKDYGGRGISIHPDWLAFEGFVGDMGERPEWANGGIDRIDPEGNYEPSNCRWATAEQQGNNRRG